MILLVTSVGSWNEQSGLDVCEAYLSDDVLGLKAEVEDLLASQNLVWARQIKCTGVKILKMNDRL